MQISEAFITQENAVAVKSTVLAACNAGDTVVDFSNVKMVDSSAVSLVMSCVRHTKSSALIIKNVPAKLVDLMKLYGVHDSLKSFIA